MTVSKGESEGTGAGAGKNILERWSAWLRGHVLAVDAVEGVLLTILMSLGGTPSTAEMNGFLFAQPSWAPLVWTCAFLPAFVLRRTFPQATALAVAALCAAQLLAGPVFLGMDFLALMFVATVIERGPARRSRAFAALALTMAALAGLAIGSAITAGPLTSLGERMANCVTHEDANNGLLSTSQMDQLAANTLWFCPSPHDWAPTAGALAAGTLSMTVAAIMVGYWRRARNRQVELLRGRNEAMRAREERAAQVAASAERARIARDMHDVVAHSLSIVIVQADGGRYAGAHDPAVARRVMRTIRDEADHALHDMGRLLGVFMPGRAGVSPGMGGVVGLDGAGRRDDHSGTGRRGTADGHGRGGSLRGGVRAKGAGAEAAAVSWSGSTGDVADLAHVDSLVAQARAASPRATVSRRILGIPDPGRLGAAGNVVAFRAVQEALSNARKYAGPTAHVEVTEDWCDDGLRLTVVDDGPGSASAADGHMPGFGLIGMRERVTKIGGTVEAGPVGADATDASAASTASATSAASTTSATSAAPDAPVMSAAPDAAGGTTGTIDTTGTKPPDVRVANDGSADLQRQTGHDMSGLALQIAEDDAADGDPMPSHGFRVAAFIPYPETPSPDVARTAMQANASDGTGADRQRGAHRHNRIERFGLWSQRHYLAVDILTTALLLFLFTMNEFSRYTFSDQQATLDSIVQTTFTILIIAPLAFRRRFPQASAAAVAVACAAQLAVAQYIIPADMLVPVSLYSVTAYGPAKARRWMFPTVLAELALIGVQVVLEALHVEYSPMRSTFISYMSPTGLVIGPTTPWRQVAASLAVGLMGTVATIGAVCVAAVAAGLWTRAKGDNLRVLETQREAIAAEAEQARALAVNDEREHIAAQIQTEVTGTLMDVIRRADEGLAMLGDAGSGDAGAGGADTGAGHAAGEAADSAPSPAQISEAFASIASAGRDALARMRRLLGVLRANRGGLDDGHMALAPAATLDEQLHGPAAGTAAKAGTAATPGADAGVRYNGDAKGARTI